MLQADVRIIRADSSYDTNYTYLVPDELRGEIREGVFVNVPLGASGKVNGIVVALQEGGETKTVDGKVYELKYVEGVNGLFQPLDGEQMRLAEDIARRYVTSVAAAYRLISVRAGKLTGKVNIVAPLADRETVDAYFKAKKSKRIQTLDAVAMLLEKGPTEENELVRHTGVTKRMLTVLVNDGIITREQTVKVMDPETYTDAEDSGKGDHAAEDSGKGDHAAGDAAYTALPVRKSDAPRVLNDEQRAALDALREKLDSGAFAEFLLRGVTGSGKTEVYFQLIDCALSRGISAIMLVPEIVLTEQMIKRITSRFGGDVAVIHGGIGPAKKAQEYERMRRGLTKIVLGARSAVFAPLKNLGLIIIDEEQEPSYKAEPAHGGAGSFAAESDIYYSAPEVAAMRMRHLNGLVVYGSATPRVTTAYRAEQGEIGFALLSKRALASSMPKVEIVDMKKEISGGNMTPVSSRLAAELHKNIEKGEKSIIFVPRRGFSARLTCENCGKVVGCRNCLIAVSYHKSADRIVCHHCGATEVAPRLCPSCGSAALTSKVYGSEMVEETVRKLFPAVNVVRMDSDTTKLPGSHEALLQQFTAPGPAILIGTQMVTKGLDFPDVTLVGVTGGDSLAAVGEYNSGERAFVLLTQVFGRAGRTAEKPGRCVLQTMDPEAKIIGQAARQDYDAFYRDTVKYRRDLDFPPFASVASITVSGKDDRGAFRLCAYLHDSLAAMAAAPLGGASAVTSQEAAALSGASAAPSLRALNSDSRSREAASREAALLAEPSAAPASQNSAAPPSQNSAAPPSQNSAAPEILKTARAAIPKVDNNYFWRFNVKCAEEKAIVELLQRFRSEVLLPLLRGEDRRLYGFEKGKPLYKVTINWI
ncbi:MAG: primosomal protein N' [Clostridia bacterium]|nr:primosomal protein N' [Clostridia bacterium]